MTERWGDHDVSSDTGLIADILSELVAVMERIATVLERDTAIAERLTTQAIKDKDLSLTIAADS